MRRLSFTAAALAMCTSLAITACHEDTQIAPDGTTPDAEVIGGDEGGETGQPDADVLPDAEVDGTEPDVEPDVDPDVEPDVDPDIVPDVDPDIVLDVDPDIVPDVDPDIVPDVDPDIVPDVDPDIVPDVDPDIVPDVDPDIIPDVDPDIIPDVDPDIIPDVDPDIIPDVDPDIVPDVEPDIVPDVEPDIVPDVEPDIVPDVEPDIVPDVEPDIVPDVVPDVEVDNGPDIIVVIEECLAATDGDACDPSNADVADGWVCVTANSSGVSACRVACEETSDCGAGERCVIAPGDPDGFCAPNACTSSFGDECGVGAKCLFITAVNRCEFDGPGIENDVCVGQGDCNKGMWCVEGACTVPECSADDSIMPCLDGAPCQLFDFGAVNGQADAGTCPVLCTIWDGSECAADEWCLPQNDLGSGICQVFGSAGEGELCTAAEDCASDLLCAGGTCRRACDPAASGADPGATCTATTCSAFSVDGSPVALGGCDLGCDYHGGTSTCAAGSTCIMGEISAVGADTCAPITVTGFPIANLASCNGAPDNSFCAGNGICFSDICYHYCAATEGALGDYAHPDCPGDTFCSDYGEAAVGYCQEAECGNAIHGSACSAVSGNPTAPGWVCLDDETGSGNGECRPACDAGTPCTSSFQCLSADGGQTNGFCGPTACSNSFDDDQCGPSAKCVDWSASGASMCVFEGSGTAGSACTAQYDCDGDTWCIDGFCTASECSTDGTTQTCLLPTDACQPFQQPTVGFADAGTCAAGCTPYTTSLLCLPGEWCLPNYDDQTTGTCYAGGSAAPGEECKTNAECPSDYICIGVCVIACDADESGTGNPGDTCLANQFCDDSVNYNGTPLEAGGCLPTCDFHAGGTGCAAGEHCRMGEWLAPLENGCNGTNNPCPQGYECLDNTPDAGGVPTTGDGFCYGPIVDFCVANPPEVPDANYPLAQGEDCAPYGLTYGAFCGPNARCWGNAGNGFANACQYYCSLVTADNDLDCPGTMTCETFGAYYWGECQ